MGGLVLIDEPPSLPVTTAKVKSHLRVEHTDDDALIDTYIAAETAFAEDYTGRAFVTQTWDYYLDAFPSECEPQDIELPLGKVTEITGVYYLDGNSPAAEQTLSAATYDVDLASVPARIRLAANASWPTIRDGLNSVRVRFSAGSEDTSALPPSSDALKDIQLAIMLRVQADYDGGEEAQALRDASLIYLKRRRVHLGLG